MSRMQEAAAAIVALINERPASPAQAEIEAVLTRFGAAFLQEAPLAMSPAHAEHYREWRHMIEAHVRTFGNPTEEGMTEAESKAEEARMEESMALIDAVADNILAEPVRTWADLLPCAEVVFWWQCGVDSHGPDALEAGPQSEGPKIDQAVAKLLSGVFALARVGQFAEASAKSSATGSDPR